MIEKLQGRQKVQWLVVSNKVNEIIEAMNKLEVYLNELELNMEKKYGKSK